MFSADPIKLSTSLWSAVSMLHEQEAWLAQNRAEIVAKVDQGYAAAERGELVDSEDARSRLAAKKRTFQPRQAGSRIKSA
jgi:predicted transcriptional regulator